MSKPPAMGAVTRRPGDFALGLAVLALVAAFLAWRLQMGAVWMLVGAWLVSALAFFFLRAGGLGKWLAGLIFIVAFGQHAALAVLIMLIVSRLSRARA